MADILFLCQRIPFPPTKGDKIRSFHILDHLARRHRIHLGTFVDDPEDRGFEADLKRYCADALVLPLDRRVATGRALLALPSATPLSIAFYRDRRMQRWVDGVLARRPAAAFLFSSAMAQYVVGHPAAPPRVVMDFVDVDSEKWAAYARDRQGPRRWVYAREAKRLLAYDRQIAARVDASLFVSQAEADLFGTLAPESAGRIHPLSNGIDTVFFDPTLTYADPYSPGKPVLVFTGAMDYEPNVKAVCWFASQVLPLVRAARPAAEFWIVGANPASAVRALDRHPGVTVTGRVADIRPYLAHADVAVAPMFLGRGIQNKVLEAMAMARPTVVSAEAVEGIGAGDGAELLVAPLSPRGFADATLEALAPGAAALGQRARRYLLDAFAWERTIAPLGACLGLP
ncbi:TIGR03087 family PEP-CTERM/XrtA system glycosyltransferase [Rhodospirillum rubrum]|uniref:Glycosyl transferases group 1 n=1 Tax=Rhodospirillum rubrum (strain ATCC 11170 / ATH 1.1.1 / DSM 467 / LMG 4362 / NCIMB 8255 / S1) TaxID=269796 RepID=Q2RPP5_RHORT|nr:TIGR03087 family PEP-CTERM/XrtA system glycosyltransferase [Rhodospirillum rubrum]ABC23900.1 glycosyl transferases group 1 [Rhodospirillum rubrum ATCC 11170]AEO49644.1 glycosyl transferases group 1 [Rhodospirillum rubrum F11]MBK5955576.1 glycosyl transferase [Rhodospirillum rubrum]QXG79845.1 TIGR03087 family PEP-CTERM/XrtA system glycosyltransferase [Rhodospirillum rubrum]HAQ00625.1 TIGR03087 family PEP-CTERM/XrtA system glycosyltransferase [Rhodospirillum rubrum]